MPRVADAAPSRSPSRRPPLPGPTEPEVAADVEPGTLTIAIPAGWGDVFEAGRSLGRAPGRFVLPAGRHRLEVRIAGVAPGRRVDVAVPAGGTARVVVEASE